MANNQTMDAIPQPQLATLIAAAIRAVITILGVFGLTHGVYTDTQIMALAGALATIVGVSWTFYEQYRQAKLRYAAAVASARAGKAIQHRDYTGVNK